jgi:hypothetical protein
VTKRGAPRGRRHRAALLAAALAAAGCASVDRLAPPPWLDAPPPGDNGWIYGVGNYVGALYPEDNLKYALDNARATLSKNLRSRVVSDTKVRETESSSSVRSDVNVTSDFVLEDAEHVDTWIDVDGVRGKRGTVWVLMRVGRG